MAVDKSISRLFSMIFHPMIMPTVAVIILYFIPSYIAFATPMQARRIIIGLVFVNTCLAPFIVVILMKKLGIVSSTLLHDRIERIYPSLVTLFFYTFTYYLFHRAGVSTVVTWFIAGATVVVSLAFLINLFWKISFHMMSMGSFTAFMIAMSFILELGMPAVIIASVLISGFVGVARLKLEAHNPAQVYAGWITGFIVMMIMMLYIRI
jgi:hypothetical protein